MPLKIERKFLWHFLFIILKVYYKYHRNSRLIILTSICFSNLNMHWSPVEVALCGDCRYKIHYYMSVHYYCIQVAKPFFLCFCFLKMYTVWFTGDCFETRNGKIYELCSLPTAVIVMLRQILDGLVRHAFLV